MTIPLDTVFFSLHVFHLAVLQSFAPCGTKRVVSGRVTERHKRVDAKRSHSWQGTKKKNAIFCYNDVKLFVLLVVGFRPELVLIGTGDLLNRAELKVKKGFAFLV